MEIEYRKATAGTKITCSICGKKFYPDKLRLHRKYFCGEKSQRTSAQSKTERKKSNMMKGTKKKINESNSESESEDEIDKQKRAIKERLTKGKTQIRILDF